MSRPSRPNFLHPARSAPAPASVTNTNVTAAMVSVPGDVDVDVDHNDLNHHDTEHRPGPVSVAPSTTGSTATTGRASSAFSLPFFAGSSASKRSTAPTVSSVSTAPGPIVPVPNVHAQAYTGQHVPVPLAGSISGASTRTTTTGTGSSTSGASTTTTTTNVRRAAPAFPPPSQSQSSRPQHASPPSATFPPTPLTPSHPVSPPTSSTPSTTTQGLPTSQARTAVIASISNLLDRELSGRASLLHQNHSAILKQEQQMTKAVDAFKKDNDKLEKLAREGTKRLKEVGDVQNWAEVLERGFLRVEETIRRANGEWGEYSDESGSWSGSGSYTGSWSGSERGEGEGEGEMEGGERQGGREGEEVVGKAEGVKVKDGGDERMVSAGDEVGKEDGGEDGMVESRSKVGGQGVTEGERVNDKKTEDVQRDAEGDVVMTTEDDVSERHFKIDKGKGKAVDDTVPEPSMVPLPHSPEPVGPGGAQFLSLTPAAV
ncbi:hypothetical protein B0T20DRAFT_509926 [Sordaria brevicollis]|uniref:Biogenesis of lysosome-related organelles complex 1 subunit 1 n=1 Tax=Sordaria brevicollis TaxID=83679 RepID=A0AAE0P395_SORBR|nr:hypothetical protein B0T20DRAFT_509926 [Sordaria brevicollis]